jgi:hypothetical protein
MGGVRTSILGRPRRLSPDRHAASSYTLNWEEPLKGGWVEARYDYDPVDSEIVDRVDLADLLDLLVSGGNSSWMPHPKPHDAFHLSGPHDRCRLRSNDRSSR